jgi:hypothetical protein
MAVKVGQTRRGSRVLRRGGGARRQRGGARGGHTVEAEAKEWTLAGV